MYAAVVYLQTQNESNYESNLIMAKAKVAPISEKKRLTIPRLELMGAVIACRTLQSTRKAVQIVETAPAIIWLDAKCVLDWIRTQNRLPTFVHNRVAEIKKTPNVEFRHVPGNINIADLPTRTSSAAELRHNELWWKGQTWLRQPENYWPPPQKVTIANDIDPQHIDANNKSTVLAVIKSEYSRPFGIEIEKFNSYAKLIRVTAYCICFVRRVSHSRVIFLLKISALENAKILRLKTIQSHAFSDILTKAQPPSQRSQLVKSIRPFVDEMGLIRYHSRFENAPLNDEV